MGAPLRSLTLRRHRFAWGLAALALAPALAACHGFPFGSCTLRVIELTMSATWGFDGGAVDADWFGTLAETNLDPPTFHPIADAFEDPTGREGSVSWILSAFDINGGYLGVSMPLPLRAGDRLTIGGVTPVGGFQLRGGRLEGAWVDVRAGDFRATAASGVIEVLSVSPLRLRVDLTAADGARTLTMTGEVTFRVMNKETECS